MIHSVNASNSFLGGRLLGIGLGSVPESVDRAVRRLHRRDAPQREM